MKNVLCLKWGKRYGAEYVNRLYRGVGIEVVWKPFLAIFLIGLVLFLISLSRFRKSVAS